MVGSFTEQAPQVAYIPNPRTKRVKRGRRRSRCIRNDMDESEARRLVKRCSACNDVGHTYKYYTKNAAGPSFVEAGPSGDATDDRPPPAHSLTTERRRRLRAATGSNIV
jgi:hypothetical protein